MFISLLTPFDTRVCGYIESNLSLVLLIKVFLTKKTCDVALLSSKHEEITFPQDFLFVFSHIFNRGYINKKKKRDNKKGGFPWDIGRVAYKRGSICWHIMAVLALLII